MTQPYNYITTPVKGPLDDVVALAQLGNLASSRRSSALQDANLASLISAREAATANAAALQPYAVESARLGIQGQQQQLAANNLAQQQAASDAVQMQNARKESMKFYDIFNRLVDHGTNPSAAMGQATELIRGQYDSEFAALVESAFVPAANEATDRQRQNDSKNLQDYIAALHGGNPSSAIQFARKMSEAAKNTAHEKDDAFWSMQLDDLVAGNIEAARNSSLFALTGVDQEAADRITDINRALSTQQDADTASSREQREQMQYVAGVAAKREEAIQAAVSIRDQTDNSLNTIERILNIPIDQLRTAFGAAQGRNWWQYLNLIGDASLTQDAINLVEQLTNQSFVTQIEAVQGTGQLSNIEGSKIQNASAAVEKRTGTFEQWLENIKNLRGLLLKTRGALENHPVVGRSVRHGGGIDTGNNYDTGPTSELLGLPQGNYGPGYQIPAEPYDQGIYRRNLRGASTSHGDITPSQVENYRTREAVINQHGTAIDEYVNSQMSDPSVQEAYNNAVRDMRVPDGRGGTRQPTVEEVDTAIREELREHAIASLVAREQRGGRLPQQAFPRGVGFDDEGRVRRGVPSRDPNAQQWYEHPYTRNPEYVIQDNLGLFRQSIIDNEGRQPTKAELDEAYQVLKSGNETAIINFFSRYER